MKTVEFAIAIFGCFLWPLLIIWRIGFAFDANGEMWEKFDSFVGLTTSYGFTLMVWGLGFIFFSLATSNSKNIMRTIGLILLVVWEIPLLLFYRL